MSENKLHVVITGIHYEIDPKTRRYTEKKAAKLIDYIPRQARKSAAAEVKITKINRKDNNTYECEIILNLPGKRLVAKDSTMNAMAAVDIVEEKIRGQIRRYKEERDSENARAGGIMALVKRSLRRR
jgi:ribosomal subunit interface protein